MFYRLTVVCENNKKIDSSARRRRYILVVEVKNAATRQKGVKKMPPDENGAPMTFDEAMAQAQAAVQAEAQAQA